MIYGLECLKIERLSLTLRQTANGKNETVAVCLQLSEQQNQYICNCGEQQETIFYFYVI